MFPGQECPVELQTSVFQMRNSPYSNLSENVDSSKLKFERLLFELFNFELYGLI